MSAVLLAGTAPLLMHGAATWTTEQSGAARYGAWGVALDGRDTSVKSGDDFFRHVNGGWYDKTDIAADEAVASVDIVLRDEVELQVRSLVEDAAKSDDASGRQLGDFWASWMDEAAVDARGTKPLKLYLDKIAGVRTRDDLLRLFTEPGARRWVSRSSRIVSSAGTARPNLVVAYLISETLQVAPARTMLD